ncbi:zinc finger protein OZF-like [Cydia amplana]|uniref:zinc finger protein OZF-like n=1 Tax=Cydia amplana TaxID=1869771 RepID=UPI002FE5FC68
MAMSNFCRCCLLRPPEKNLKKPYTRLGKTEIYSNMLKECFEIHLTYLPNDDECGICEVCVGRLRDASDFKLQVQRSQDEMRSCLRRKCHVKVEEDSPKAEMSDDFNAIQEELVHVAIEVKTEVDPLPTEEIEEFKLFMTDLENQTLDVCKQEPASEIPTNEQSHVTSPKSCITEVLGHGMKLKKERKTRTSARNKNAPYKCDTCGRQFRREVGLNIHKKTHTREDFLCEICNKKFKIKSHLDLHKKFHPGDKPFWCGKCKKNFSDKSSLNKHKRTHNGEKPFACDICKARYTQKQNLISHMALHTGLKHFRCNLCPVKFKDHLSLRTHIRKNHISPTYYTCDECQRVFCYRGELIRHMNNTHYKWTIYACDICGLTLATKYGLRRHKIVHTGEKAYTCEMCNKQFSHKQGLNAHILTHTGERPHCCEVCGKQFSQRNNLKKHLQIHVEGKIYACQLCTKSYSTSEGLRQHRRTHMKNNQVKR